MMEVDVKEALSYLGKEVKDSVTGFEGIVSSVDFDLTGTTSGYVMPKALDGHHMKKGEWINLSKLVLTSTHRVVAHPEPRFIFG
jgi:hypothetical protein